MKLKTVEIAGVKYAVIVDDKPVYTANDGTETPIDVPSTVATIARLNGEAKAHREAKEAALGSLKLFEGLDPEAARKALTTIQNIDAKKLVDSGEIERVKSEAIKAVEAQYAPIKEENASLKKELYSERVGGAFARSLFIKEKTVVPVDLLQAKFSSNFKDEGGKVVAYAPNGNPIYSATRPGEIADFDEAISTLIDMYPGKEHILKGNGQSGTGARSPGGGHSQAGQKIITRSQFSALDPVERGAKMADGYTVVDG